MHFIMSVDVESHSLLLNREDPGTAREVYDVGLLRVLKLLSKYDVEGTFYFTGNIVESISPIHCKKSIFEN